MFENVQLQGIPNNPFTSTVSAVLWIISPRRYSNQMKRPLTYNFNGNLLNEAEQAVSKMAELNDQRGIRTMASSPMWLKSIFPNADGHFLNMEPLAPKWTFMLVINNDKSNPGGGLRTTVDNQHIYYGYFVDEPFNLILHFGKRTYNPDSVLMITHKTQINKSNTFHPGGAVPQITVMSDVDVIHPSMMGVLSPEKMTLLRPQELYASTDDVTPVIMQAESAMLDRQGDPLMVAAGMSIPHNNFEKILGAVGGARGSMYYDAASGSSGMLMNFGRDTFRDLVEENLKDNSHLNHMGLAVNSLITLGNIIRQYNPRIETAEQDYNPRYSPIDQSTKSARNVFASLLTTIVPALLVEYKLLDIAFYYDSHQRILQLFGETPPSTIVPMPSAAMQYQVNGFNQRLISEIFPILTDSHGHFQLKMQCSSVGVTHINLIFLDDIIRSDEVFEVPTIFGGLNSALVGSSDVFRHNAGELNHLITGLIETHTDRQTFMNPVNEDQFSRAMLNYENQHSAAALTIPPSNHWGI